MSQDADQELLEAEAQLWWDSAQARLRYSVEYAQQGIKSLFLANGGAIIALLTFAGNTKAILEPRALFWSFLWFGVGIGFSLSAYIAGYISQSEIMQDEFLYSRHVILRNLHKATPYKATKHEKNGELAVKIGLACAIASLAFFVVGSFVGLDAVT